MDQAEPEVPPVQFVPKTVLITGATSGIGRAVAMKLTQDGHRVIATGWRSDKRDELKRDRPDIFAVLALNVALKDEFGKLNDELDRLGVDVIDTLFANAGIHIEHPWDHPGVPYEEWPHDSIDCKTMQVNYFGAVRTVRALLDRVKRSRDGRILFTNGRLGSFSWHEHPDAKIRASLTNEHPSYAASKAALNMYMKHHLAPSHPELFVASLNPGWVETTVGGSGSGGFRPQPVVRAVPHLVKYLVGDVDRSLTGKFIEARDKLTPW